MKGNRINMYFEFNVLVVYREFTGEYHKNQYRFFAKSKTHAEKIARELLYLTDGVPEQDLQFVVKYVTPSDSTITKIKQEIESILLKLDKTFADKDYKDYLNIFQKKQGYGAKFNVTGKVKEYYFDYNNLVVKVLYTEGTCKVDRNYVVYKDMMKERNYLFTENLNKVVLCKVG